MAKSESYWQRMSKNIENPSQTYNKRPDISSKDAVFIRNYLTETDEVIDIGSGTGQVTNKLLPFVKNITAVETFIGLSQYIIEDPRMMVINAKLEGFRIRKSFDVAIATGVMQCFPKADVIDLCTNLFEMVQKGGVLIMRTHCGLEETIVVDKSEELGDYFAEYRQVDEEKKMLQEIGFSEVKVLDEAPSELNVWDNSRHFMFVCKK